nr:VP1 [Cambodia Anopheles rhabdovirus]WOE89348.1 VP1 [Cambodia Anopheles rhabdovirus]WOE89352.1 VP1 [Cambodia Anopheles rhabdovirus]
MASNYSDYSTYKLIGCRDVAIPSYTPLKRDVGEYVKTWFDQHPDDKPTIRIIVPAGHPTVQAVANAFYTPRDPHVVSVEHINWMIYELTKEWKEIAPEEWVSFGRKLTKEDKSVTMSDLFTFETTTSTSELPAWYLEAPNGGEPIGVMYYVYAVLRLVSKYPDYNAALAKKMKETMPSDIKIKPLLHSAVATKYGSWASNLTFRKLAAAVDMFLDRFPRHQHSKIRLGTIITRNKDSSLINSVSFLYNTLGVPGQVMAAWVWNRHAAEQICKILHPDNMIGENYGYNAYGCALELVAKSINSITQNGELHLFIHTIGAVLNKDRSKNAYFPENVDTYDIVKSAFLVAGIKQLAPTTDIQFAAGGNPATELSDDEDITGAESVEGEPAPLTYSQIMKKAPVGLDPMSWSNFLNAYKDYKIRERLVYKSAKNCLGWTNLRDGSVGKRVQEMARSIVEMLEDIIED